MNGLRIEARVLSDYTPLSADIAKISADRLQKGSIVVVAKQPGGLKDSLVRHWGLLLKQLERERAKSMDPAEIAAITQKIARMQQADISDKSPAEDFTADILFSTADHLQKAAPICWTMFIATPTPLEAMHKITSFMPVDGVVYIYKLPAELERP